MSTECNPESYDFGRVEGRRLVADFGGGTLSSNGGALLLRQVVKATGPLDRLAGCCTDYQAEDRVVHGVPTLLGQRLFGLALGYEDLNDHDELWQLAWAVFSPGARIARRWPGVTRSAGWSIRLRVRRCAITKPAMIERVLARLFLGAKAAPPDQIVLDLDASDIPLHGDQAGKFFHGDDATIATCHFTSFAANISWQQSCGWPISTVPPVRSRRSRGSWLRSVTGDRRSRSSCVPIATLPAMR